MLFKSVGIQKQFKDFLTELWENREWNIYANEWITKLSPRLSSPGSSWFRIFAVCHSPRIYVRVQDCDSDDRECITANKFRGFDKKARKTERRAGKNLRRRVKFPRKSISYLAFFFLFFCFFYPTDSFILTFLLVQFPRDASSLSCFPHALIKIHSFPSSIEPRIISSRNRSFTFHEFHRSVLSFVDSCCFRLII